MNTPLAYFLTFTCYGAWRPGDENGSVDPDPNTPAAPAPSPYLLDQPRRQVTLQALCEIARRKGWRLHAAHVRSNHIHLVVTAEKPPERILNDIKTAASRRLNKMFPAERNRPRWTRHGSTHSLWTEDAVAEKVHYVLEGQGESLERYPSRAHSAAE